MCKKLKNFSQLKKTKLKSFKKKQIFLKLQLNFCKEMVKT